CPNLALHSSPTRRSSDLPDPRESMSAFYTLYYGWHGANMDRLYQLMSTQAQFWNDSWDTIQSTARKGIWGNSNGIYDKRRPARRSEEHTSELQSRAEMCR